jgi:tetratricopeptide (TPR) repeat protein
MDIRRPRLTPSSQAAYLRGMRKAQTPSPSGAIIILRQMAKHEWIFRLPRIGEEVDDRVEDGIDWMDADLKRSVSIFRKLIREYPEHIDAHHHLALTLDLMGRTDEAFELWEKAVTTALKFFPSHFSMEQDRLEWGHIENRPFLRLYHSFGLQLMKRGETENALDVFEKILTLNPNDNQGARGLAVECYFSLKRPEEVLSVCRQYPQDIKEQMLYGRPLALFQLSRVKEASKALDIAIENFPLIAIELLMTKHRKPKGAKAGYVTLGGADQAYLYWREHARYWTETPGAIEFLRERLLGKSRKKR